MKFYDHMRRLSRSNALLVAFLTVVITFAIIFPSSAQFQPETLRLINVSEASATFLGAVSDRHLSGNGNPANFDVSLANLRAHAVAVGDVNGDGIQDVVMASPDATFTVGAQTRTNAGVVYIVFGKSTLTGAIDTGEQSDLKILGGKTGDRLGFSVAIGDVNGDGTNDIVIGAPGADFPGTTAPPTPARADTGAVFVILGAAALGTPQTIDLNTANAANIALYGVNIGDQFGASVAVGDVGGLTSQSPADQAAKDILAGAPGNNGPTGSSRPGAGAAYVQFGGSYLNPVGGATTVRDLSTALANVIVFGRTGDMLGASVAIGDINGGGIADVVIGAPLADRPAAPPVPAGTDTGAVFAIFGGANLNAVGTSKTFDISTSQQNVSIYGAGNTNTPGTGDADHFGFSIAVSDVTGDSIPDLLIGAPDADAFGETRASAGEAYVIQGGTSLNPTSGSERRVDLFTGDPTVNIITIYGAQAGDHFGSTVAAGNYNIAENVDNTPDFLIGAPGGNNKAGYVSVIFGGPTILLLSQRDVALGQDSVRVLGQGSTSNDLSGKTLRIRQTLTTTDQAVSPFLQQLMISVNGSTVVNDDTQAQFGVALSSSNVTAANTAIPGDTTAAGDLELTSNPALSLNGTTSFMSVGNSASLKPGSGSWTVEFWLKRAGAGTGDFPQVIGSRAWSIPLDKGWAIELDSANSFKVSAHFADGTTGFDAPTTQSANGTSVGTWEHWAVVFDRAGNNVVFYKNGAQDASRSVTFPTGTVDQADPILVGADKATGGTRFLNGTVDDIRVWNTARTAQQISDNFKLTLLGTETGLGAYWNFNNGTANDLTVNANNGTLNGGAAIVSPADRRFLTGNRVSTFTFPAATVATTSAISWVQTTAAGTSIKIETSLDNGATFQTASNGSGLPSVGQGDEIGWAIATGDVNNDHGGDLLVGAPFANAVTTGGTRTQAGLVYVLPSTTSPPPVNVPPTVHVTAPNGGETLQVGQQFDIKWDSSDLNGDNTIQKFEVRLSTDGGSNFSLTILPNPSGTSRKLTWTVPIGFNTTQGRIQVIATDDQGATGQDQSDANFTITDAGTSATITAPNGGEILKFGQQFTITWTVPTAVAASVKGFDISLSTDGGTTFPIQIAPPSDPTQPALGPGIRQFVWTVPSICTKTARVAVVTTSLSNVQTSSKSAANFIIGEPGPTIDTSSMFINNNTQLFLITTTPAGGTEVLFKDGLVVEISTDATGTTFATFTKPGRIKKNGGKFLSKGSIGGQDLGTFFPNGATRFIRATNPVCGITLIKVTRSGDQLLLAAAEDAAVAPAQSRPVWQ
ncbi:MAG TPA: LamG-like jellyroll fold domain-containing protein [Blastocatellia bacterium]|nr:LamG-like jellyroll fold domain-containing protein [Blastocatellia bacterium]